MRKNLTFTALLPLLITCFLLTGCFSTWSGNDEGNFTISFGSPAAGSRATFLPEGVEVENLTHIVLLHNGPGPDQTRIIPPGTQTASFSVTPGRWTITVEAYLKLDDDMKAWGETTANIKPGKNEAITIQMGSATFTVTFDLNYEGAEKKTWEVVSVTRGKTASRPENPSRDEYGFVGWYREKECINVFNFNTPITGDIILYAGWSEDILIVTFVDQDGAPLASETIGAGGTVTPPDVSKPGYEFDGWYEEDATTKFNFSAPIYGSLTLYARWLKVLTIEVISPETTFSPVNESIEFAVTVSGFENPTDMTGVELEITSIDGLRFHPDSTPSTGIMTFTVTVMPDNDFPFPDVSTAIAVVEITGLPLSYRSPENGEATIAIADGLVEARAIPVTPGNIEDFNGYANTDNGLERYYKLAEDIDLGTISGLSWWPIGTSDNPFIGSFDGNGNTITGLTISSTATYVGMFGYIDSDGVVTKLHLEGVDITGSNSSTDCYVGGIAGYNEGDISDCSTTGTVTGNATGGGNEAYAGGVVGKSDGTVKYCYATSNITATSLYFDSYAGGVVGKNVNTVQNCYYTTGIITGQYVGGVVGQNGGAVQNCYATGTVTGGNYAGGVVGENESSGQVEKCYATGNVSASNTYANAYAGGVVGFGNGSVAKCVALNPNVSGYNIDKIGRILGEGTGATLTNNYGLADMTNSDNASWPYVVPSGKDGADVYGSTGSTPSQQYTDPTFWTQTMLWNSPNVVWDFDNVTAGGLPTLLDP